MNDSADRCFSSFFLLFWFVATYLVHVFALLFFINTFVVLFSTESFFPVHTFMFLRMSASVFSEGGGGGGDDVFIYEIEQNNRYFMYTNRQ